jgi:hypothetical protein
MRNIYTKYMLARMKPAAMWTSGVVLVEPLSEVREAM